MRGLWQGVHTGTVARLQEALLEPDQMVLLLPLSLRVGQNAYSQICKYVNAR